MPQEQASQFESGIASGADDSGLDCGHHQASSSLIRETTREADFVSPAITKIVSSPPTVPTMSSQPSASRAAATGCALPALVFTTTRFCALRTSYTNSRMSRSTEGSHASAESSLVGSRYP